MCGLRCTVCVKCVQNDLTFLISPSWVRLEMKHKEGVPALDKDKLKTYVEFLLNFASLFQQ